MEKAEIQSNENYLLLTGILGIIFVNVLALFLPYSSVIGIIYAVCLLLCLSIYGITYLRLPEKSVFKILIIITIINGTINLLALLVFVPELFGIEFLIGAILGVFLSVGMAWLLVRLIANAENIGKGVKKKEKKEDDVWEKE